MTVEIIWVLFAHYIADFPCQTRWMANNKSISVWALTSHVSVYTSILFLFMLWIVQPWNAFYYALGNGVIHWAVDYCTSKLSRLFYLEKNEKAFWSTIGFDQFLHAVSLIITYGVMFSG